MRARTRLRWLAGLCLGLAACGSNDNNNATTTAGNASATGYSATIRRTAYGVPHVLAGDFGSLGYGQGYAQAQDHACTVADQIVKVRSERARFFGRGDDDSNLNSDLAYLALDVYGRAERGFAAQPDDVKEFLTGYAAGFNAFLAATPSRRLPGWCASETVAPSWVRPITPVDLAAYFNGFALFASGASLLDFIATAQPPDGSGAQGMAVPFSRFAAGGGSAFRPSPGSNGWAIGADRSAGGHGMLVANPHFPWEGELRFWENQLTIPGRLNVYGASLIGVPTIQVGFNEHVAWTHTVSAGLRLTMYSLDLVPGDPTSYLYDGAPRAMTARPFTVKVGGADGSETEVTRTLYFSHYGPIINFPDIGWNTQSTLTYRDANIDNDKGAAQYLGMDGAASLAELQHVHAEVQGIGFVNTIATTPGGTAWYADTAATPNLSPQAITAWQQAVQTDPLVGAFYADGFNDVLLDGSRSLFEWVDAPGARSPGLMPASGMPQVERADYVFNANDSHWLANPAAPLEGFSPLQGQERMPVSPRTRRNLLTLSDRSTAGPSGPDGRFSLPELQTAILRNAGVIGELLRDAVVERCRSANTVTVGDEEIDLREACDVLARWDGRADLQSAGAPLWREFVTSFSYADLSGAPDGILFAQPFDPADPMGTPSGLAAAPAQGSDPILQNLGIAVHHLQAGGFALGATLGDLQFSVHDPGHTPVHGGTNPEGVENVVEVGTGGLKTSLEPEPPVGPSIDGSYGLTADGYPIAFGTSFLLAMEYTDAGPHAASVLTSSESGDPSSAHFADQGALFSRKQWKPVVFTEAEIAADPALEIITVTGERAPSR